MPFGYLGRILRIDLSLGAVEVEEQDDFFYRTYIGGGCLGAYYLLTEQEPKIDPLDPQSIIVFAPSVVTGAPVPGFSRFSVVAKSPLNGLISESQAGGFWGAELKQAGFDAVVITGKCEHPCYVWIQDGEVEIREASHLWGTCIPEAQEIIRKETNDRRTRVALIGPAGENLVRFASIINELRYANGRGGLGAVMGSKNLKAVAVRGQSKPSMADRDSVLELSNRFSQTFMENPSNHALSTVGTPGTVNVNNSDGQLPTRNFQSGVFGEADSISGETMAETILIGTEGCYACPVRCKRVIDFHDPSIHEELKAGPEYETLAALGSNCGVGDLITICKANQLCDIYGMDTISTGMVVSFAMECFERGVLSLSDTSGIDLHFGNGQAMLRLIEDIAQRRGLGELLGQGALRAAQQLGGGSENFVLHTRGREFAMHDPRGKGMVGLSYAVSPIGADHGVAEHDVAFDLQAPEVFVEQAKPIGLLQREPRESVSEDKVRMFYYLQQHFSMLDTLAICTFTVAPVNTFTLTELVRLVSAITGWETSLWELMKAGERRVNMFRIFNLLEESPLDRDELPKRMFEPIGEGPRAGAKLEEEEFHRALTLYREIMNWDEKGVPRRAKLIELNLDWLDPLAAAYRVQ